jgi:chaperone BCS1
MKNGKNNKITEMLRHFLEIEKLHLERGIPYKKSFLFYGPPGTGKSSMIKAMSFELQRHIHYLILSNV